MAAIISYEEALSYLQKDTAEVKEKDVINQFILAAQAMIESYCGQEILQGDRTLFFQQNQYENSKHLAHKEVTAIKSVKSKGNPLSSFITIDSSLYSLIEMNNNFFVYFESFMPCNCYEIVYTSGFTDIPDVIKQVAYEMVSIMQKESNYAPHPRLGLNADTTTMSNQGITTNTQFTASSVMETKWRKMLSNYTIYQGKTTPK